MRFQYRVWVILLICIVSFHKNLVAAPGYTADLFHDLREYTQYLDRSTGVYDELKDCFTLASGIDDWSQSVL